MPLILAPRHGLLRITDRAAIGTHVEGLGAVEEEKGKPVRSGASVRGKVEFRIDRRVRRSERLIVVGARGLVAARRREPKPSVTRRIANARGKVRGVAAPREHPVRINRRRILEALRYNRLRTPNRSPAQGEHHDQECFHRALHDHETGCMTLVIKPIELRSLPPEIAETTHSAGLHAYRRSMQARTSATLSIRITPACTKPGVGRRSNWPPIV